MTRKLVIAHIVYAGYHNDTGSMIQLYAENRISYPVAQEAFRKGQSLRKSGMKCTCAECQKC